VMPTLTRDVPVAIIEVLGNTAMTLSASMLRERESEIGHKRTEQFRRNMLEPDERIPWLSCNLAVFGVMQAIIVWVVEGSLSLSVHIPSVLCCT
jgi:hypothetical protein